MDPLTVFLIIIAAIVIAIGVPLTVRAYRRQVYTGREYMVGRTGQVKEDLAPQGMVLVDGELWTAVSAKGSIKAGEEVMVNKVRGLKLDVSRKE
jgi:membrane-bound serine protease (ClpP class)